MHTLMTDDKTDPMASQRSEDRDRPIRVLVVEDDDEMRYLLVHVLKAHGLEVTDRADGFYWMDFCLGTSIEAKGEIYDVVVSDIRMPGMTGLEILEGLKYSRRNPPTILISAFCDEKTREQGIQLGAAAVIEKPFNLELLVDLIREVVDEHGRAEDKMDSGEWFG